MAPTPGAVVPPGGLDERTDAGSAPWSVPDVARSPTTPRWVQQVALVAPVVLVVLAVVYGVLVRLWLLAHLPLFGDEAVVGLMAKAILGGHFSAFYWGQHYGGAEAYVVAGLLKASASSPTALNVAPMVLAALAAGIVTALVMEATGNLRLAALAGATAWVWPYAAVWNSVREIGFRGVTLLCGLLMVLAAMQIHRKSSPLWPYVLLGLSAGVGWWASPEIVYFVVPTAVLLVAAWDRLFAALRSQQLQAHQRTGRASAALGPPPSAGPVNVKPLLIVVGSALVGALPWIYANLTEQPRFASLRSSALPAYMGEGYPARVAIFFRHTLPVAFGLHGVPAGAGWVGGDVVGPALDGLLVALVVVAVGRVAWAARLGRRSAPMVAVAAGVVVYPFLAAAVPTSGDWFDGRYAVYLAPLVIVLFALALAGPPLPTLERAPWAQSRRWRERPGRRRSVVGAAALLVACLGLVAATAVTVEASHVSADVPFSPSAFFAHWSDPNAAARAVVKEMERHGIKDAFSTYWSAYTLDYLSGGKLLVTPSAEDYVRDVPLLRTVDLSPQPAWLFVAPGSADQAYAAFDNGQPGPGGWSEAQFEHLLESQGVTWRVIHLGVLDAVIPSKKVALPGPAPAA